MKTLRFTVVLLICGFASAQEIDEDRSFYDTNFYDNDYALGDDYQYDETFNAYRLEYLQNNIYNDALTPDADDYKIYKEVDGANLRYGTLEETDYDSDFLVRRIENEDSFDKELYNNGRESIMNNQEAVLETNNMDYRNYNRPGTTSNNADIDIPETNNLEVDDVKRRRIQNTINVDDVNTRSAW